MTAATGAAPVSAEETVARLSAWFDERFAHLAALGDELIAHLGFDEKGDLDLSGTARRGMKAAAARFLAEHDVVDGCGLIFAHSALGTEAGRLEWWVREDESRFARYSFGVVPGTDRYYDYEQHEWFIRAYSEGRSAAVGPFIDYLGVEVYIVTLTVPAEVGDRRVGAVGTDIQIDDLERALLPTLLRCDAELALLSRHGSVLISNSADYLPGDHLPSPPAGTRFVPLSEVTDGMHVLVSDRSRSHSRP